MTKKNSNSSWILIDIQTGRNNAEIPSNITENSIFITCISIPKNLNSSRYFRIFSILIHADDFLQTNVFVLMRFIFHSSARKRADGTHTLEFDMPRDLKENYWSQFQTNRRRKYLSFYLQNSYRCIFLFASA